MDKPKVALYWCASCGGCEEAVVDLEEQLLELAAAVEIVLWPVALDFKYADLRALDDGAIAAALVNGAIRTSEQQEMAALLRRKSRLLVAVGACAGSGGVPALANLTSRETIFSRSYGAAPAVVNPDGVVPRVETVIGGHTLRLPEIYPAVYALDQVVQVDYYLPGCPPTAALMGQALAAILSGELPPRGAVLAPDRALCASCERNPSKPEDLAVDRIRRLTEVSPDPERCFLAQGLICKGPATRDGCGQSCIAGNMPCSGCFGPTGACQDQGAKMIATLGGILKGDSEAALAEALEGLADPAGTFYRYGMAGALLRKEVR